MKKIILSLILALAVIFSCICPAFASSAWVLNEDAQSITHNGTTYLPVYDVKNYHFSSVGGIREDLEFVNNETRNKYEGSYIIAYNGSPDVIEVVIDSVILFVSESYMQEFRNLQNGEGIVYEVQNEYGIVAEIEPEDYLNCTSEATFSNVSEVNFEWYDLFAVDEKGFACASGAVVKAKSTGKLYILKFSDYDSSYFYADGSFARHNRVTLYAIEDSDVVYTINQLINARPDDELDWLVGKEPSKTAKMVSAIIFFMVIPAGIIIFCVIMLIKAKKKMYRCPLIVLMSAAALLLLSAVFIFI